MRRIVGLAAVLVVLAWGQARSHRMAHKARKISPGGVFKLPHMGVKSP